MLKFYKIVLIVMSILLLNSCDEYCEITDYEDYFPLEVGNKWYYGDNGTREITGQKEINGEVYYEVRVEHEVPGAGLNFYNEYYRFYRSKLFRVFNDNIFIMADFSLKEGDEFTQDNTGFNVLVLSDDHNKFTFSYNHPDLVDEEYEITFKKDVGIISDCSYAWVGCTNLTEYELY